MKQRVTAGGYIETVTTDELNDMLGKHAPPKVSFWRPSATAALNAAGIGQVEVCKVPLGMRLELRRVTVDISSANGDPFNGVPLGGFAGAFVVYQRSGTRIGMAILQSAGTGAAGVEVIQIPGTQTWGDQQGPNLVNGENFEVFANLSHYVGTVANAELTVTAEGLLVDDQRPGLERRTRR